MARDRRSACVRPAGAGNWVIGVSVLNVVGFIVLPSTQVLFGTGDWSVLQTLVRGGVLFSQPFGLFWYLAAPSELNPVMSEVFY